MMRKNNRYLSEIGDTCDTCDGTFITYICVFTIIYFMCNIHLIYIYKV